MFKRKIRRRVWENKAFSFKEAEEFDTKFWKKQKASTKFSITWMMISDYLKMRGKSGSLPRLRKSIQTIKYL